MKRACLYVILIAHVAAAQGRIAGFFALSLREWSMVSIRNKLIIVLLLVSIIPVAVVGLMEMRNSENALREHIGISSFHAHEMFRDNLIKIGMNSAKYAQAGKEGYLLETSEHGLSSFSSYT